MGNNSSSKPKSTRILGIDFGLSRLGLAWSDENKIIATPLKTVTAEKKTEETAKKIVNILMQLQQDNNCEIEEIIIGLPLMMSGKTSFLADEVKHFTQTLNQFTLIPVRMWDERLTTVQAERSLRESQMTRKQRTKYVDTVSATIILQSYLDCKSFPVL